MFTESYSRSGRDDISWPSYAHWVGSAIDAEAVEHGRVSALLTAAHDRVRELGAAGQLARAEDADRQANGAAIVAGRVKPGPVAVTALTEQRADAAEDVAALTSALDAAGFSVLDAFTDHEATLVEAAREKIDEAAAGAVEAAEALAVALSNLEEPVRQIVYARACVDRDSRTARKNDPATADPGSTLLNVAGRLVEVNDWGRSTVTVGALVALVQAHAGERVASAAPAEPAPVEAPAPATDGKTRELPPAPSTDADGKPTNRPKGRRVTVKVL